MKRKFQKINNLRISYLDNEKSGRTLICLHGHFGTASMFSFLDGIFPGRVVIPDQRGHGFSDRGLTYRREDYFKDLEELIESLNIEQPVILGHSLGGINAIQYAAKTQNVSKLIIEDIGTEINVSADYLSAFPEAFGSIYDVNQTMLRQLGRPLSNYFMESLYYDMEINSWKFRFHSQGIIQSHRELTGSYKAEWEKVNCPSLLLHGEKSWLTNHTSMIEMAKANPFATLIHYDNSGHGIHDDDREKFCQDIIDFISK